ncbi:MAG TPA: hypothetical protein VMU06_01685 [Stellaceae bacterium]|nr:hypothetical protein [Stellaceae bacterium]
MKTSSRSSKPKRPWWQWILMYPTLAVTIVGAVPQYQQWFWALVRGIPLGSNVTELQDQDSAWQQNLDCLARIDHVTPPSETPYAIDLLTCPSGDILLTVKPLNASTQAVSRWIITNKLFQAPARSAWIPSALAQTPPPRPGTAQPERVIDVRKDGSQVIRRVQLSNGSCVDQVIDSYTGRHLGDKPAPCTRFAGR